VDLFAVVEDQPEPHRTEAEEEEEEVVVVRDVPPFATLSCSNPSWKSSM
jgi:hypothetical protein